MDSNSGIPKFQSEAEEAQWWFDHREDTAILFEKAVSEGRTTNLAEIVRKRQEAESTNTVSIRIEPADVSRAMVLAERRGLLYQTYLKMLLHEALETEDRRLAG